MRYPSLALFLLVSISLSMPLSATNLPVEHESVRLLLAIDKSIESAAWAQAKSQLLALEKLNADLPPRYHYYKGIIFKQSDLLSEAQESLEAYVINTGSAGEYYTQALELITEIEESKSSAPPSRNNPDLAQILPSGDGYIKSLQALFLTEDPIKALTLQINSLLASHPYTGSRVRKQQIESGIEYTISVSGQDIVVQEKRFNNGQPSLKVNKLNVLGVDPFLNYGCSIDEHACWIYDPTKPYERWLLIERDEIVAQELSKALSKLMLGLQT